TIKAERSDPARERAGLADFSDGRPFVLSSAGIAAPQELTQSWPPSAPASQALCWNTRSVARRQRTIATRRSAVRFETASVINRGTELRAQDRKKLLQTERLLEHG